MIFTTAVLIATSLTFARTSDVRLTHTHKREKKKKRDQWGKVNQPPTGPPTGGLPLMAPGHSPSAVSAATAGTPCRPLDFFAEGTGGVPWFQITTNCGEKTHEGFLLFFSSSSLLPGKVGAEAPFSYY